MKIIWSPLALERLTEIYEYISLDKPTAALEWVESIFDSVENLSIFPNHGRQVPELESEQYQELIVGNYRVIYEVIEPEVHILTIRRGSQLLHPEDIYE